METPEPKSRRYLPFGALLKRHRLAAGLSQEELAERAHVSVRAISAYERGHRTVPYRETVRLLADALGLTAHERADLEAAVPRRHGPRGAPAPPEARAELPLAAVRPRPGGATVPALVGRERELVLLERRLAGQGPPVLLLAGEPGIGKSRLLAAAAERATELGWHVLAGGCQRQAGQEPYVPLLQALESDIASQPLARLRVRLQGCAWLVRLLPELAARPIESLPAWTLRPEQERRLLFRAVVGQYLANIAGPAGTLLLLDDLQWAGADALNLLTTLVRQHEGTVRVIGAYRQTEMGAQHPLSGMLADLAQAGLAAQHALLRLSSAAAASLPPRSGCLHQA